MPLLLQGMHIVMAFEASLTLIIYSLLQQTLIETTKLGQGFYSPS